MRRALLVAVVCLPLLGQVALWKSYFDSGIARRLEGNYAQARQLLFQAVQQAEKLPPGDPRLTVSLFELGKLYRILGKYEEAESLLNRALELRRAQLGKSHPDIVVVLKVLGEVAMLRGQYATAENHYLACLDMEMSAAQPSQLGLAASYR